MDVENPIVQILASLPLVVPTIWALLATAPRPERMHILFFHNAAAGIGATIIAAILALSALAFLINEPIGACDFGLLIPSNCDNIPNDLGDLTYGIYFLGLVYLLFIGLPAALLLTGAEIVTRKREKKAKQNA